MSFKVHLIIVSAIVVAVYLAWQWMGAARPAAPAPRPEEPSFSIAIAHASWGLNCRAPANTSSWNTDTAAPREDNVLLAVSDLCNGKEKCAVNLNAPALGADPAPSCKLKELAVEYRCFSYDRPRAASASSGMLTLDCSKVKRP